MAFLAPNARWMGRTPTGEPVINGYLKTYQAGSEIPKVTYQDFEEKIPNANPIRLDDAGEANIYWLDDEYYRIILLTEDLQQVYDQDDYPYLRNKNVSPIVDNTNKNNIVRNPQFTYWSNGASLTNIASSANDYDFIVDDWLFRKVNSTSNINASQIRLNLTDASIPGDPEDVLDIACTVIGSLTESKIEIYQKYGSVRTFANKSVTLSFSAKVVGALSGQISAHAYQVFGTGGSPSADVDNSFGFFDLTQAFQTFNQTITIDSLTGKTEGTDNNSCLELAFRFPNNVIFEIQLGSVQIIEGEVNLPFDYLSQNDQYLRLYRNANAFFKTGDFKNTISTVNDDGWVLCNNQTIGNQISNSVVSAMFTKALFIKLWNSALNIYCPIFNSDGTLGTRGSSGDSDFNLNKQLALTPTLGRVLAGANPNDMASLDKFIDAATDVNIAGNYIQLNDSSSFYNGTIIQFGFTGSLPTSTPQVVAGVPYYAINVGSNRIKLATTLAQSLTLTANITFTVVGSGTIAIGVLDTFSPLCSYVGEQAHGLTLPETINHNHANTAVIGTAFANGQVISITNAGGSSAFSNLPGSASNIPVSGGVTMTNAFSGGSGLHNNLQPTLYTNIMIKL